MSIVWFSSIFIVILVSIIIVICRKISTNYNNSNSPKIDEQNQNISTYRITNVNENINKGEFVSHDYYYNTMRPNIDPQTLDDIQQNEQKQQT